MNLIITCEHAGHEVPEEFLNLFQGQEEVLHSHRGWDPGALDISQYLAKHLGAPLYYQPVTRLLIEMNRSLDSPELFSEFTRNLPSLQQQKIIQDYYHPYRDRLLTNISTLPKPVVHLSIHSFTPVWKGEVRATDIGLLFDPDRKHEAMFCSTMQQSLNRLGSFQIDFNKPYLGTDDGFTTSLRTLFDDESYIGIEVEVNQKYAQQFEPIASVLAVAISASQ